MSEDQSPYRGEGEEDNHRLSLRIINGRVKGRYGDQWLIDDFDKLEDDISKALSAKDATISRQAERLKELDKATDGYHILINEFGNKIAAQNQELSPLREENERLTRLLRERDEFLAKYGLLTIFVGQVIQREEAIAAEDKKRS